MAALLSLVASWARRLSIIITRALFVPLMHLLLQGALLELQGTFDDLKPDEIEGLFGEQNKVWVSTDR